MRQIFFSKKWLLGFALALVYIPLRTYLNVPQDVWATILRKLPLFCMEIVISTVFYTSWIYLVDWGLRQLDSLTGSSGSGEFKLVNQLIALIPAILLAILFNMILSHTWRLMDSLWSHTPRMEFRNRPAPMVRLLWRRANEALTVLALIAAYYLCVSDQIQERLKKVQINAEKLEKENLNARFLALKNQISPHFLFNNLSVLSSLVESRPEKSSEFIQQLSMAYRYILEQAELHQISLEEEIKFLETYTYLLRTRFKDKIVMDIRLSPEDLKRYSVIPLTLQLLIENAVKHNTMSVSNPLTIVISIESGILIVKNHLQLRKLSEPTTGLGLKNIVNRYKLLLGKEVVIEKNADHFVVKIPLIA
ncbi:sensor histidine kinase [Dyadobacter aurulentus]|uniref:sensor histidine kinase n=1 Tax=Dyadobacter sp. UC 10 TaxID=2605428 RepID=UPI0011F32609|nr:histidine kinase [Dyadobacter sp. UC 10]KAA0991932.1 histidine kinase [Dyadobacter sp. UC 10]